MHDALTRQVGVLKAAVNFDTKEVVVEYDPTKTKPATIAGQLQKDTDGRYTATIKS
ncbi:MAG: cation transporter [Armatimonadetes bacterium]|nr:cation transporter [Armatimonadota bacterium]